MSKTKTQIRDRAANDLGLLPLGQALKSQDSTRILAGYDEVYKGLEELELAVWPSDGSVPDLVASYVISLVAENCLNTYAVSNDRYIRIKNEANAARREIPLLIRPDYDDSTEADDY